MKDKNLPNDYISKSLEELTREANKMIEDLENQKDLESSQEKYQNLLKLNNISDEVLMELSQKNKNAKKVYDSYSNFLKRVRAKNTWLTHRTLLN